MVDFRHINSSYKRIEGDLDMKRINSTGRTSDRNPSRFVNNWRKFKNRTTLPRFIDIEVNRLANIPLFVIIGATELFVM